MMQIPEVVYGIGIPALIMGLLRILSGLGVPRKLIPLLAVIIGPGLALLVQADLQVSLGQAVLVGLYWGLASVGTHSGIKNVAQYVINKTS